MSDSLLLRFLGVEADAEPHVLLGLEHPPRDRVEIENAVRTRLEAVWRHPDGRGAAADTVRRLLREAAAQLVEGLGAPAAAQSVERLGAPSTAPMRPVRAGTSSAASAARVALTEFDQYVWATFVACGGWNARCRARLVALAEQRGLTARGLFRVIEGLGRHARAARGLDVESITSGTGRVQAPPAGEQDPEPLRIAKRVSQEASDEPARPWPTVRLALLCGLLTTFFGVLVLRAVFNERAVPTPQALPYTEAPRPSVETVGASAETVTTPRVARFRPYPTFLGNALPPAATDGADGAGALAGELDALARQIAATGEPAEAVFRTWTWAVDAAASGWVLVDDSTRSKIGLAIFDVLAEVGDAPSAGDRMLGALMPPSERIAEPLDVWRGAWQAGTLASIASHASLPPAVTDRARSQLLVVFGEPGPAELDFAAVAALWLDLAAGDLVERTERDARSNDFWETWNAAQRKLDGDERRNAAYVDAIGRLLRSATDLARAGPSVNVLGRMLLLADLRSSRAVRDGFVALFEDEAGITTHDLWVLTSLVAQCRAAPWFGEELVLPDDATVVFRRRIRDRMIAAWPAAGAELESAPAGERVTVDLERGARWLDAALAYDVPERADDEALVAHLVRGAWLELAAAHLAAQHMEEADSALDAALAEPSSKARVVPPSVPRAPKSRPAPGMVPAGPAGGAWPDGEWAKAYEESRGSTSKKLEGLRALRTRTGAELGPLDTETLVREAYRGSPHEVRELARSIVIQDFAASRLAALELLDQFPDAPHNEGVSEMVHRVTGGLLPDSRSDAWEAEARLALATHALELCPGGIGSIDDSAADLSRILGEREDLVRRARSASAHARPSPEQAVASLAEALHERAQLVVTASPVPDDLSGLWQRRITRRRLADGAVQLFVAEQLAVLDLFTYTLVAEQPDAEEEALALLAEGSRRRRASDHVLEQAIVSQMTLLRLWSLRLALEAPSTGRAPSDARAAANGAGITAAGRPPGAVLLALLAAPRALAPPDPEPPRAQPAQRWSARLSGLDPVRPMAYFELAEEIADEADEPDDLALARRCFALAGVFDTARLGRSACLALADLEPDEREGRRLLALAGLLGSGGFADSAPGAGAVSDDGSLRPAAVERVVEAFSHYRRGQGSRALAVLRDDGAEALLDKCDPLLPGGANRFLEGCRSFRGKVRPDLSPDELGRMLQLEIAILSGDDRPWSAALVFGRGLPFIEVDPDDLGESLGVDPLRAWWRDGQWVERESAP